MTDTGCIAPGCTSAQPLPDGYAHRSHTDRAARQLREIADAVPAARDVAHGQSRRGSSQRGGGGRRLELNLAAAARLAGVQGELTTWARHVIGHRGDRVLVHDRDPLIAAARTLAGQAEWFRNRQEVDEFLPAIDTARRVLVGLIDGGGSRRYLGPCNAIVVEHSVDPADVQPGEWEVSGTICQGDVYARESASTGHCRVCEGEVDVHARRAWLDETVRARSFRASQIEQAFGIRANTIIKWAARGRLVPDLEPLPDGVHGPWAIWEDEQGRRRFHLGAVLELAEQDAARRRATEAKRAEREAEAGMRQFTVKVTDTIQPCTYCGEPGHWAEAGRKGHYAAPSGHAIREDGTMDCPRARQEHRPNG